MEIDLGQEVVIKVRLGEKVFELREPTLNDVTKLADVEKGDAMAATLALQEFAVGLGMPKEVVSKLGVMKLKTLAEGLTGSFSEKK